ncbi:M61 family metallopeptidase [Pedobacter sp. SL55]|uniref:M61 family metallopeptidase n=1 Tax=Pedobacter sp. SL55 TaxID=2995161 RepID=UPI00226F0DFA|nr:PDZ domain-containing protein [Pedobacter sp. SL55]WAC42009.1 PDZ domain-containing protein [Pedobacter sp. SL55]
MKNYLLIVFLFGATTIAKSQQEISYTVSFPNAVHHEAEVSMTIPNVPANAPLKVRFARSSPGRYATHEFGKNIYNLKAFDTNGKPLKLKQPAGDVYEITKANGKIKVTYTVFGNWIDGTYAGFDETHAHMNIPAVFAFPIGMDKKPRTVKFNFTGKADWKVATQLKALGNGVYYAKDFQYFMDSPIEISNYKKASFEVKNTNGKTQTIHLIAHSEDDEMTVFNYANMLKKVVDEQKAIFGELPTFDDGNYYFLHCVHPSYAGDGMEHRNSTVIVQRTPKIGGYENNLLGTFSHEFFHAWNVERLRPRTLEPFNFTQANISDELWLAEGFTQYYGNLALKRAGFRNLEDISRVFGGLVNSVINSPGAKNFTPVQASRYAVFADAGVAVDQTNQRNIFTSYYTYGAAVGLALDLRLRTDFKLILDDYMKALWKAYGKTEIAYTIPDLEKTLASLTKKPVFAKQFFNSYVYATKKEDYASLLLKAGLVLQKSSAGKAYTGIGRLEVNQGKVTMPATLVGSPAYIAGLDIEDVILKADGSDIKTAKDFEAVTEKHQPGETIEVVYSRKGVEKTTKLTFIENPSLEVLPIENTGGTLTAEMKVFREKWLESAVK